MRQKPPFSDVKGFWETNPLCAAEIPHERGSEAYFAAFDRLRDKLEPAPFAATFYRHDDFRGKNVLEVGCGNGWVIQGYARAGAHVFGLDATQTGIDLTRKRFELRGLQASLTVGNAEELPYADGTFDAVCSMGVLHHVPDTEKAFREIWRVLKPGGTFFVMLYHRNSVLYRFKFPLLKLLTGKSMAQLVNEVDGAGNPKGDVYTRAEMAALLAGYRNVEISVRLIEGWMTLPWIGRHLPDALFRPLESRLGWFLYGKGIKPI